MRLGGKVAAAYAVLLGGIWIGVSRRVAVPAAAATVGAAERASVIAQLRAIVDGKPRPQASAPATAWQGVATVWCAGEERARAALDSRPGRELSVGADLASEALGALEPGARDACRLKVDVLLGRAPIASSIDPLLAVSLVPGIDGLGMQYGDGEVLILPDELLHADILAGHRPLPSVDFDVGLDTHAAIRALALRAGASAERWRDTPHRLFRFATQGFVEPASHRGAPLPVLRGNPPGPSVTRAALHQAALAGGAYLRRHQHPVAGGGARFDYEYYTLSDGSTPEGGEYSLARHAGAAYFLAQLSRSDGANAEATRQALRFLVAASPDGCDRPELACVGDTAPHAGPRVVDLGTAALALCAAVEYQRATGDAEFAPWSRRLAAFLLAMQKPNGDFCHLYDPASGTRNEHTEMLYFSGEAALALAKLDALSPDPRLTAAIDRALGFLTDGDYGGALAAKFFFGEDHWTCIAVDAAWDLLAPGARRDALGDFCEGFAAFSRRSQFSDGDPALAAQPDLFGGYGFTPLMPPHPTPVGSRTEAMVSTLRVAEKRGHHAVAAALRRQILGSFRFLLAHQIRDDGAYLMANPEAARGGFMMSDVKRTIRIDFIQHCCSAMLRGEDLSD